MENGIGKSARIHINYEVIPGFMPIDSGGLNKLMLVAMEKKMSVSFLEEEQRNESISERVYEIKEIFRN